MNRRTTHTRLARLEAQQATPAHCTCEVWVGTGEDDLLGPNGDILSTEEFERRYAHAHIVSLDDAPAPEAHHQRSTTNQGTVCNRRTTP